MTAPAAAPASLPEPPPAEEPSKRSQPTWLHFIYLTIGCAAVLGGVSYLTALAPGQSSQASTQPTSYTPIEQRYLHGTAYNRVYDQYDSHAAQRVLKAGYLACHFIHGVADGTGAINATGVVNQGYHFKPRATQVILQEAFNSGLCGETQVQR